MANTTLPTAVDVAPTIFPTETTTNCSCSINMTEEDQTSTLSYPILISYMLASTIVFVLNAGVLCIVLSRKKLRNEASLTYCVSLSAADVTLALAYMLNVLVVRLNIQEPLVCIIAKNLLLVCGMLSAGSVTLLVIHRYVSVRLPILHRKSHTLTVSVCVCVSMWILCTLSRFLPYAMEQNKSAYEECDSESSYFEELPSVVLKLSIVGFSILGLIVLLHVLTFLEVKRLYRKITPKVLRSKNSSIYKSKVGQIFMSQPFDTEIANVATTSTSKGQDSQSSLNKRLKVECQFPITTETSFEEEIIPNNSVPKRYVQKNSSICNEKREKDIKILTGVSKTAKITTFLIIAMFVFNLPVLVLLAIAGFGNKHNLHAPENAILRRAVSLLHFMNALVHPIIYAGNQEQIRSHVTQTISRWNCRRNR